MREIRQIIRELGERGKTIMLSSHLLWEVERTCTHVAIIRQGRIVRQASVEEMTAGAIVAGIQSNDLSALEKAAASYPGAITTSTRDDTVVVELKDENLSDLNRFLAGQGIYVSQLGLVQKSLEDVFMELTNGEGHGMGAIE